MNVLLGIIQEANDPIAAHCELNGKVLTITPRDADGNTILHTHHGWSGVEADKLALVIDAYQACLQNPTLTNLIAGAARAHCDGRTADCETYTRVLSTALEVL